MEISAKLGPAAVPPAVAAEAARLAAESDSLLDRNKAVLRRLTILGWAGLPAELRAPAADLRTGQTALHRFAADFASHGPPYLAQLAAVDNTTAGQRAALTALGEALVAAGLTQAAEPLHGYSASATELAALPPIPRGTHVKALLDTVRTRHDQTVAAWQILEPRVAAAATAREIFLVQLRALVPLTDAWEEASLGREAAIARIRTAWPALETGARAYGQFLYDAIFGEGAWSVVALLLLLPFAPLMRAFGPRRAGSGRVALASLTAGAIVLTLLLHRPAAKNTPVATPVQRVDFIQGLVVNHDDRVWRVISTCAEPHSRNDSGTLDKAGTENASKKLGLGYGQANSFACPVTLEGGTSTCVLHGGEICSIRNGKLANDGRY